MELFFSEDANGIEEIEAAYSASISDAMNEAASFCCMEEGLDPAFCQLNVSFVSAGEIRSLNKEYRGNDSVTDVLSFPQYGRDEILAMAGKPSEDSRPIELGDVVICLEKADEQACEFGHTFLREAVYLFVHSVFHLLGYDHMEANEKRAMREKEEIVMSRLSLARE